MAQDKSKITLNVTLLISFVTENANRANSKYITNNWQKSTIDQNIWKNNSKYGKKTKVRTMKIKVTVIQIQETITNAASPLKKPLKTSNFMWMHFINMRYFNFELISELMMLCSRILKNWDFLNQNDHKSDWTSNLDTKKLPKLSALYAAEN